MGWLPPAGCSENHCNAGSTLRTSSTPIPSLLLPLLCPACCSNVATHCAAKLLEEGAVVLAMSDSRGYLYEPAGFTPEQLAQAREGTARRGQAGAVVLAMSDSGGYVSV